jgi:hypothetical protein
MNTAAALSPSTPKNWQPFAQQPRQGVAATRALPSVSAYSLPQYRLPPPTPLPSGFPAGYPLVTPEPPPSPPPVVPPAEHGALQAALLQQQPAPPPAPPFQQHPRHHPAAVAPPTPNSPIFMAPTSPPRRPPASQRRHTSVRKRTTMQVAWVREAQRDTNAARFFTPRELEHRLQLRAAHERRARRTQAFPVPPQGADQMPATCRTRASHFWDARPPGRTRLVPTTEREWRGYDPLPLRTQHARAWAPRLQCPRGTIDKLAVPKDDAVKPPPDDQTRQLRHHEALLREIVRDTMRRHHGQPPTPPKQPGPRRNRWRLPRRHDGGGELARAEVGWALRGDYAATHAAATQAAVTHVMDAHVYIAADTGSAVPAPWDSAEAWAEQEHWDGLRSSTTGWLYDPPSYTEQQLQLHWEQAEEQQAELAQRPDTAQSVSSQVADVMAQSMVYE